MHAEGTSRGAGHRFAEFDYFAYHFVRRFQNHELLTGSQGYNCMRRHLNVLNKIGIHNQRDLVYAGELDHRVTPSHGERLCYIDGSRPGFTFFLGAYV